MASFESRHFINRELSWLEFNRRVLGEALDPLNPLLERIKFFVIFSTNLDEFFEVRVAGIKQEVESGVSVRSNDGLSPAEILRAITHQVRRLMSEQYACWRDDLVPALAKNGIRFLDFDQLSPADLKWVNHYYHAEVRPVLTPLAIDRSHPFPQLLNKSLNIVVQLENANAPGLARQLAIVQVPRILSRFIQLPRDTAGHDYLFLAKLIGHHLDDLFSGVKLRGHWLFRVTRNGELYIDDEEVSNLLKAVEIELHKRRRGEAVRLEIQHDCPDEIRLALLEHLHLNQEDLYEINGPMDPHHLMQIYEDNASPELRDVPFIARLPEALRDNPNVFEIIRKQDVLVHHPYESFDCVVDFLEQAATDPQVLAIKQTLYRTGGEPRIVGALMKAVNNGKQVTVVVELRARFDEANNIEWTRRLEEAGVHVVYGLVGLKIHAKLCLIIRREEQGIRRYVHISTGNYNPVTARIYTDLGLFTCQPDFGEDATDLFNLLTGVCQFQGMRQFSVAPFTLHKRIPELIRRETEHARQGLPARIIAKMNSLVDRETIESLYLASQAGVGIDLIVRGICCLRPQLRGISKNITVRSIVDRFLEHSRVLYFENACQPELYISSADWMPRNLYRRIEVMFPVKSGVLRERIREEILSLCLRDNVKAWILQPDGSYRRQKPRKGQPSTRSQIAFLRLASEGSHETTHHRTTQKKYPEVKLAHTPHR